MKILIIGGVAGGAGAAARLRRLSETDEIIMFEKTPYISYANCGLPYYIGGVIQDREDLLVQTVEGLSERFNLDIRVNSEVLSIDKDAKSVAVKNLISGEQYSETYDKLVLSPGAKAIIPPIENINDVNNVFTLKTIPDTDKVYNYIKDNDVKKAVVVGGGFIGVETAENLVELGMEVTLIDFMDQIIAGPADFEMAQYLHRELTSKGIKLILSDLVSKISKDGKQVITKNGVTVDTDLIIMSVGIRPATDIAQIAGLDLHEKTRAILVDDRFRTSDKNIYAVGDAIMQKNTLGKDAMIPLAWGANRQARQVADSIHGKTIKKDIIKGANALKVFDKTFASVGLTEKAAKAEGLDFDVIYATRANHAGYYPGATPMVLKLIFNNKTAEIYGAQGVGNDGVEKRIDVISTAMKFGGKATDLSSIEICYAPPFNSAKDPVNILGYIAENVMEGVYKTVQYHEIDKIIKDGGTLVDVRTVGEFEYGHIIDCGLLPVDEIRANTDMLPKDKNAPLYITCQVGHRAYVAIQILKNLGYTNLYNLTGGYGLYDTAMSVFK
jgi:NADPH-dependent 2,4-dienoyl-CoA reductase/sulfur reductase-like enzyme/rhodanese-related sulfurtransferase